MLRVLEQRRFPATEVRALASPRSLGRTIAFAGKDLVVHAANPAAFEGVRFALFSAGASASRELAPAAAERGAVVIDNSSAWRMDPLVPSSFPK
jgi:aspartate-semialdehyde dehydrogenase